MNVNDLRNGDPVLVNFTGERELAIEAAEYHGWTDEGVVVLACNSEHTIRWNEPTQYVTFHGQTVTHPRDDEVLPATRAENE